MQFAIKSIRLHGKSITIRNNGQTDLGRPTRLVVLIKNIYCITELVQLWVAPFGLEIKIELKKPYCLCPCLSSDFT